MPIVLQVFRREPHAFRDIGLAMTIIAAPTRSSIEQPACYVRRQQFARFLILELVNAAFAASVAQRFPFRARHRRQRFGFPKRRSEEHTSELQSLMRNSYAVFCLKKKNTSKSITNI